jgi:c-di-GMP-binding flagellar brake protein YcgR
MEALRARFEQIRRLPPRTDGCSMKQTTHDRTEKRNERRKEPRIQINQEVTITLLGEPDSPPFQAVAEDMSGSGMRILSQHPAPYQTVVKVQMRDLLLLGEVIRVQVCDRGNMVALKFWHSLDADSVQHILKY